MIDIFFLPSFALCYQMFTLSLATLTKASELPREDKDKFYLVIGDVYAPTQDGFKLLELVGLEMDLQSQSGDPLVIVLFKYFHNIFTRCPRFKALLM
jgi:hypothetical protein